MRTAVGQGGPARCWRPPPSAWDRPLRPQPSPHPAYTVLLQLELGPEKWDSLSTGHPEEGAVPGRSWAPHHRDVSASDPRLRILTACVFG